MSATNRQNTLLAAEDWKRIYQSIQSADFQSYDFDNLRRVMINYIRENYPEDFNDYIESSEYLALIDLLAFIGQSISFRIDLNARDNFLELAERRESVLRLSRLLGYKAKRNIAASGLLKFSTVSTTQVIVDSNGRNLSNQTITWNDPSNANWYDQFIRVINAALPSTDQFGNSTIKDTVYGIPTEAYKFQTINRDVPVFGFTKAVDGRSMDFEVVSTTFSGRNEIYEEPPAAGNRMSFIYRDDGRGNASSNTGFFVLFKEGSLGQGTFTLNQPAPGESVDVDVENINNSDVWLYKLDSNNVETSLWTQVPEIEGNNIIYNSLKKSIRDIFSVITRSNDRVSLLFSDGVFGNLPKGSFRVYYRTSNRLSYTVNPRDIKNVSIDIPYISAVGQQETISISLTLQSAVSNSAPSETSASIKARAPAVFYTQNRMITAEDYNIAPLGVSQSIVKTKAINRSASGISRYFDLIDPTGKYSKTTMFADDGVLYRQFYASNFQFKFKTKTDIETVIHNQVSDVLKDTGLKHFYYANFDRKKFEAGTIAWVNRTADTNQSTGYLMSVIANTIEPVSTYTSNVLRYFTVNSLVKFVPPSGYYFDTAANNRLVKIVNNTLPLNSSLVIWTKVVRIQGDGTANKTGILSSGQGPIVLNEIVPDPVTQGSTKFYPTIAEIIPAWKTALSQGVVMTMIDMIHANKPFGLRYDTETLQWAIVKESNLNMSDVFSLGRSGDTSNSKMDSSWLILFTTDTESYNVKYRVCQHVFESEQQVRFFYDSSSRIYDSKTNSTVKDTISILSINTDPASLDQSSAFTRNNIWEVSAEVVGIDGYVDNKKIGISFYDSDSDGVVDNPVLFETVVQPSIDQPNKYIVLKRYTVSSGYEDYKYTPNTNGEVIIEANEATARSFIASKKNTASPVASGQHFYFIDTNTVQEFNSKTSEFAISNAYRVYQGRDKIKFQYTHNADSQTRIDPGITNLIDVYVLTRDYDTQYRRWLTGAVTTQPLAPSSDALYNTLAPSLNAIKSVSDEVIYHPVQYRVLFGPKAAAEMQATFKIVKNPEIVISDNDLKTRVLNAINNFFALDNWDFGDTFYFSELTAYVISQLSPNLVSFTIVPKLSGTAFGNLFEITAQPDQIFISGATIDDIEIIPAITATAIKSAINTAEQTVLIKQAVTSSGAANGI